MARVLARGSHAMYKWVTGTGLGPRPNPLSPQFLPFLPIPCGIMFQKSFTLIFSFNKPIKLNSLFENFFYLYGLLFKHAFLDEDKICMFDAFSCFSVFPPEIITLYQRICSPSVLEVDEFLLSSCSMGTLSTCIETWFDKFLDFSTSTAMWSHI